MLHIRFDDELEMVWIESTKRKRKSKLKPAKQRANQKQAKVWATKVARKGKV